MARRPPDRQLPPPVQRLRLRYAKRGRLRFSSHRDFQRAFERALRRASVPIAFSSGFSPHPKVSYASAAPTGASSEAEYLEIAVTARCDPDRLRKALDDALPEGLDVVEVVEARTPDFPARLEASLWRIELPGADEALVRSAVEAFLAKDSLEVERLTKSGLRTFDARGAVVALALAEPGPPCAILEAVVRHGAPTVRPDDVLAALRRVADLVPPEPPRATRLAQGPLGAQGDGLGDPLAPDRPGLPA